MNSITVITSGKGGVGKSTVTFGLGAVFAARGKRVLLIDGDAGLGSLDHMLGVSAQKVFDIADVVSGAVKPDKAVYKCAFIPNLFLLPAPGMDEDTVSPDIMKPFVSALSRYYDHILIDSPAGIGQGFSSAAAAANRALVIVTPDPVSLRGASQAGQKLDKLGIMQRRLVINRFKSDTFRAQGYYRDLDSVIDAAGIQLIAVIPEDPLLAAATVRAEPPLPKSPGMLAAARLAARLLGEQVPVPPLENF